MRVLYFHQHFSTPDGATGTRSYEFAKALINVGHHVTIVCGSYWIATSGLVGPFSNGVRRGKVEGINIIELELPYSNADGLIKRSLLFIKYSIRGIRIALKESYDLIFATSTPLTAGIPGIIAKLVRRKPFIFEIRDLWPELPKAMGVIKNPFLLFTLDVLETVSYKYADKCVALAPGIAAGINRKYANKEVIVIPNGSGGAFQAQCKTRQAGDKLIAVFTGAHGLANGLGAVLDVAELLDAQGETGVEIQFIGDGKIKSSLVERAITNEIKCVKFMDPMPKRELFEYLKNNAHVGLMVLDNIPEFYRGTSPNKFFDYISLSLPVINNYPGWLAEMIMEYQCGVAVSPKPAKDFMNALIYMKDNESQRQKMSNQAQKLSRARFSRSDLSKQFVEYLDVR